MPKIVIQIEGNMIGVHIIASVNYITSLAFCNRLGQIPLFAESLSEGDDRRLVIRPKYNKYDFWGKTGTVIWTKLFIVTSLVYS